ncbi:MAG: hypothetical protein HQL58_05595 [Magnetococcales bacterium]|nr:hypothetical protein [Magnetococcales bacterium]
MSSIFDQIKAHPHQALALYRQACPSLKQSGECWQGHCPFPDHEDRNPSFTVYADGRFNCFGCQRHGSIIDLQQLLYGGTTMEAAHQVAEAMGLAQSIGSKPANKKEWIAEPFGSVSERPKGFDKASGHWCYHNAAGAPMVLKLRFDEDGQKRFEPWTWCRHSQTGAHQWRKQDGPAPRDLYDRHRLPKEPGGTVVIVEGEKTVEAARLLLPELTITTLPNGASSVAQTDLTHI